MDDLISRQTAINAVTAWLHKALYPLNRSKYNEGEIDAYETALSELKRIPSAVSTVRHGRWADHREQDGAWSCTACGEEMTICSCGKDKTWEFPYCPNCGAEMTEVRDDE